MARVTSSPVCVLLTKMHVRGSSTSFGWRASRARFERAFRGFLERGQLVFAWIERRHTQSATWICREIAGQNFRNGMHVMIVCLDLGVVPS